MRSPESELDSIRDAGLLRRTRALVPLPGARVADASGRIYANFSSNDYLGLASTPQLRESMAKAARDLGSGSGASRLISGTHPAHRDLEDRLASFKSTPAALAFTSGFAAALGALTALLQKGDTVILDKLCHASLIDGARLSGATVRIFPHNNLDKLRRLLRSAAENPAYHADSRTLVVTESVFSMDGDRAALPEIVELKDRYGALLLLDEAHAFGIIGSGGRGLADHLGLSQRIDLFLGTLSKAVGVSGGFIAADRPWIDLLTNRARSLIYTTAPPPAVAAAAAHAIDLLESDEGARRRAALWKNIRQFAQLRRIADPSSAIIPQIIGDESAAVETSTALQDLGLLVPAVRFPTVAKGTARLRITFSADHTPDQIESLTAALPPTDKPLGA